MIPEIPNNELISRLFGIIDVGNVKLEQTRVGNLKSGVSDKNGLFEVSDGFIQVNLDREGTWVPMNPTEQLNGVGFRSHRVRVGVAIGRSSCWSFDEGVVDEWG